MKAPRIRKKDNEEFRIQDSVRRMLAIRDWVTMRTHGNKYQKGFPDLYALHHNYGARWVEIKKPRGSVLTKAQMSTFPVIGQGHGIWVMKAATESEYKKLHQAQNWRGMLVSPDITIRGVDPSALLHLIPESGPESLIQNELMTTMRDQGWTCIPTTGNLYQHGFPDFWAYHPEYGARWCEVKRKVKYSFTPAQHKFFPLIAQTGHGIWILTSTYDIPKLQAKPNWWQFMYN